MELIIKNIVTYPVKSMAGNETKNAMCLTTGLKDDRKWVVIDANNKFVTQRQLPLLATIKTSVTNDKLTLRHPKTGAVTIAPSHFNDAAELVTVWKDENKALIADNLSSQWLTETLGKFKNAKLRLAMFSSQDERKVGTKYLPKQNATLQFADACPYLITFEESLEALSSKLGIAIPMNRFRGNIVLSGLPPWEEYKVSKIKHESSLEFTMVGPCQRCQMTSIDQTNGSIATPGQPLQTLMNDFPAKPDGLPYFGMHAYISKGADATITVGDKVRAQLK
ncbi:MAG: MOSC domain-containing protein [Alteromonadaceae bacterium]|nr:MOSC domain-containing protein [Alteromonadaceae bacterium]